MTTENAPQSDQGGTDNKLKMDICFADGKLMVVLSGDENAGPLPAPHFVSAIADLAEAIAKNPNQSKLRLGTPEEYYQVERRMADSMMSARARQMVDDGVWGQHEGTKTTWVTGQCTGFSSCRCDGKKLNGRPLCKHANPHDCDADCWAGWPLDQRCQKERCVKYSGRTTT